MRNVLAEYPRSENVTGAVSLTQRSSIKIIELGVTSLARVQYGEKKKREREKEEERKQGKRAFAGKKIDRDV